VLVSDEKGFWGEVLAEAHRRPRTVFHFTAELEQQEQEAGQAGPNPTIR
jgi:hypothetical protein